MAGSEIHERHGIHAALNRVGGQAIASFVVAAVLLALGGADPDSAVASVGYHETYTQTIDAGRSLNAVSCVPATSTCVAADSNGNLLYATDASATSAATWNSWGGPGPSPSEALECPASTLCLLAAGEVSGGGGNLYRASSLGGSFLTSVWPANGVGDISCPAASFCVSGEEGEGFIRYTTNPSKPSWTTLVIGSGAMKGVSCLSVSFCAVVDDSGNVHVATSEKHIKESGGTGWTSTDVDGSAVLRAIACSSPTSCVAVDASGKVLNLTIGFDGEATASGQDIEGADELVALTCIGPTCAAVDSNGAAFSSTNAGADWSLRYGGGAAFTSVSCASASLCAAVTGTGDVTTFDPASTVPPLTITSNLLPAGAVGAPYEAQVQATGGTLPYQWSATGLPPGLSIDPASGRISGTPNSAVCVRSPCPQPPAIYMPTITVIDSDGVQASAPLTIALAGKTHALRVATAGTGSGQVNSSPIGIAGCGISTGTCEASFEDGTMITLVAKPATGSTFSGWSGGGCSGTHLCQLAPFAGAAITATFAAAPVPPPTHCLVPKLKDESLKAAKRKIRSAGCSVGKLIKRKGASARTGEIVKQVPKPGTSVPAATKVKITLAP
jgi:hypothetical protein